MRSTIISAMAPRSTSGVHQRDAADIPLGTIARACAGDERALEDLIRTYQGRIARFVIAQIGDHHDYEDLCQTIFVKMALAIPKLKQPVTFESWLFRIARNVCIDHLRHRRWWQRMFFALDSEHESVAAEPDGPDPRQADLERAIARLPAPDRELINLAQDEHRSHRELARLTNLSIGALKSRLFRARTRLRQLIADGAEPNES
jgi:RNA polymerase sigma-70 factor (ECF subfamily)